MAIIVEHKETRNKYIFLGPGFGAYKATRESFLGGNLFPHVDEGNIQVAAVCNREGEIEWFATEVLRVIEVDGMEVKNFKVIHSPLQHFDETSELVEDCPGCGTKVSEEAKVCYSCGLTLLDEE